MRGRHVVERRCVGCSKPSRRETGSGVEELHFNEVRLRQVVDGEGRHWVRTVRIAPVREIRKRLEFVCTAGTPCALLHVCVDGNACWNASFKRKSGGRSASGKMKRRPVEPLRGRPAPPSRTPARQTGDMQVWYRE